MIENINDNNFSWVVILPQENGHIVSVTSSDRNCRIFEKSHGDYNFLKNITVKEPTRMSLSEYKFIINNRLVATNLKENALSLTGKYKSIIPVREVSKKGYMGRHKLGTSIIDFNISVEELVNFVDDVFKANTHIFSESTKIPIIISSRYRSIRSFITDGTSAFFRKLCDLENVTSNLLINIDLDYLKVIKELFGKEKGSLRVEIFDNHVQSNNAVVVTFSTDVCRLEFLSERKNTADGLESRAERALEVVESVQSKSLEIQLNTSEIKSLIKETSSIIKSDNVSFIVWDFSGKNNAIRLSTHNITHKIETVVGATNGEFKLKVVTPAMLYLIKLMQIAIKSDVLDIHLGKIESATDDEDIFIFYTTDKNVMHLIAMEGKITKYAPRRNNEN